MTSLSPTRLFSFTIRPALSFTLFPYTTLFRSRALAMGVPSTLHDPKVPFHGTFGAPDEPDRAQPRRSEEHTSELQSQPNLVCRLLPEKKKLFRTSSQRCLRCKRHCSILFRVTK